MNKNIRFGIVIYAFGTISQVSAGQWSAGLFAGQSDFDEFIDVCFDTDFECRTDGQGTTMGFNLGYSFSEN